MSVQVAIPVVLSMLGTLATGDGKDVVTLPFNGRVDHAHMLLGANGATSGDTDVTVYYTKPTAGVSASGDLWTVVATTVGSLANDSSVLYQEIEAASIVAAAAEVEAGGTLSLNVDEVPGTASTDLLVTVWIVPTDA
jgi:hypothetical protein